VKFWDASAVVPLVIQEKETGECRKLLSEDRDMVVWLFTPVEVTSALTRRLREKSLTLTDFRNAKRQLGVLERSWLEVTLVERVRERARRLLENHPLRAADSLQLAAAVVACEGNPEGMQFVTLDGRLGEAAEKEGFTLTLPHTALST
jgi:predicted nucleic acid-binding protein